MLKRNKKFIKFVLCSLAITGVLQSNVKAMNNFENAKIKSNSVAMNRVQSEDEKRAKLKQEYDTNKLFKDFVDVITREDKTFDKKSHEEQIAAILEINQKMQIAKDSNTLSKEALDLVDEAIKELEPTYSNLLKEAKDRDIKPVPVPKEKKDEAEVAPKEKEEKAKQKIEEKTKQKIEKHLPKTGSMVDNNLFLQLGTTASLLGIYIMKKKK